ncbi:MAG: CPBP family intramembrane glutamic endopeptidase [Steroidobacteraceae bacterium]
MSFLNWLRSLPTWIEFVIVVAVCWGLALVGSIMGLVVGLEERVLDSAAFGQFLVIELVSFAIAYWFLGVRGWSYAAFPLGVGWRTTGAGLLLVVAITLVNWVVVSFGLALGANIEPLKQITQSISINLPTAIVVSIVNGAFEELFLVGYVFAALWDRGVPFVIGTSVVLRVLAHVYQGPVGAFSILGMGLVFGLVYLRYRQLWPLIFAHITVDALALGRL